MTPGTFNVKKLIEFGLHALISQVGLAGEAAEHVPALATEGLKHFHIPESVEMPLPLEVLGKVLVANVRRQQQIDEAWRKQREQDAHPEQ